jgi:hypothetical protein
LVESRHQLVLHKPLRKANRLKQGYREFSGDEEISLDFLCRRLGSVLESITGSRVFDDELKKRSLEYIDEGDSDRYLPISNPLFYEVRRETIEFEKRDGSGSNTVAFSHRTSEGNIQVSLEAHLGGKYDKIYLEGMSGQSILFLVGHEKVFYSDSMRLSRKIEASLDTHIVLNHKILMSNPGSENTMNLAPIRGLPFRFSVEDAVHPSQPSKINDMDGVMNNKLCSLNPQPFGKDFMYYALRCVAGDIYASSMHPKFYEAFFESAHHPEIKK